MKLTEEMYNRVKDNKRTCTIYNDQYVLLTKTMPAEDEFLEEYLNNMKKLQDMGVNISTVVDYRLIPGTTSTYQNGKVSYTKGVFLEEKAPGQNCGEHSSFSVNNLSNEESLSEIKKYINANEEYVSFLEAKNKAPQEVYDKLVSDYLSFQKCGLTPDPKASNFFFDSKKGYTFIDPIPLPSKSKESKEFLPQYIYNAVFGYGKPILYLPGIFGREFMSSALSARYQAVFMLLQAKIIKALRNAKIDEEYIKAAMERQSYQLTNYTVVEDDKAIEHLADIIAKKEEEKEPEDNFTFN